MGTDAPHVPRKDAGRAQVGPAPAELGPRAGPAIDSQYVAETEWLMLKKQVVTCTKLEPEPL